MPSRGKSRKGVAHPGVPAANAVGGDKAVGSVGSGAAGEGAAGADQGRGRPWVQLEGEKGQRCKLVMCEDPETGKIIVKPEGTCPEGYIQRIIDKSSAGGVTFRWPKVSSEPKPDDKGKNEE